MNVTQHTLRLRSINNRTVSFHREQGTPDNQVNADVATRPLLELEFCKQKVFHRMLKF